MLSKRSQALTAGRFQQKQKQDENNNLENECCAFLKTKKQNSNSLHSFSKTSPFALLWQQIHYCTTESLPHLQRSHQYCEGEHSSTLFFLCFYLFPQKVNREDLARHSLSGTSDCRINCLSHFSTRSPLSTGR